MQLAASLPRHQEKKTNGAAGDTSLPLYLALLSVLSTQAALQPSRSLREVRCCRNQQEVAGTGFSLMAIPVAGNGGWHPAGPSRHHTEPAAQGQPSKAQGTCTDIILSGQRVMFTFPIQEPVISQRIAVLLAAIGPTVC